MYRKTVKAPVSMAMAARQVRWSETRETSLIRTRIRWARSGAPTPSIFSTVST